MTKTPPLLPAQKKLLSDSQKNKIVISYARHAGKTTIMQTYLRLKAKWVGEQQ